MDTPRNATGEDQRSLLLEKRVAFAGKLGGMNRREAADVVRQHGGVPVDRNDAGLDILVIGADHIPLLDDESNEQLGVAPGTEIIHETELWARLGWLPAEDAIRQLYTPAMLAELLHVPISVIRRWHRQGLIVPVREVQRLAYFDFQEIATARHLAQLLAAGASPAAIEKKLQQISEWFPNVKRPLAQLSIIVEGRDLLLRRGAGLIDATGQQRFDFRDSDDADLPLDQEQESVTHDPDQAAEVISIADHIGDSAAATPSVSGLIAMANDYEATGQLEQAIEACRVALCIGGPDADVNFQLAELLYRLGDVVAARERYYTTLEIDANYVEARANLGCVLAELGSLELAVAAFEGALRRHDDYPDAHYHLARTLDELGQSGESDLHWRRFIKLAPTSPWAAEARDRLGWQTEDSDS